ncbi:sarcosine oxidase subunit gamma [Planktotalea sp.]|uniref:sarcosine oxidase subunit gamma n=1 Tax=Planktotalea sp. TaxID=2029877 RepID=UPI003D6A7817
MHNLKAITALGGQEPRVDRIGENTLRENAGLALASVHARLGQEEACRAHLQDLLEGRVPAIGKAVLRDPEAAFWTGPDQWMVGALFDTHEELADQLRARFGSTASITEQTDAWACFDLQGATMDAVMELLCPVNMRAMQTGDAQRTSIHHLGCFVIRREPSDWVRILGPRASATSLHHAIITAMQSVA